LNEAQITVTGWVATEPFYAHTANGTPYLSLRIGCTPRRFDRQTGQWQDVDTMFLTVQCWRALADNVLASELRRGYPVVVTGRLRIRQYEKDGAGRFAAEIEAATVGPDLNRGTTAVRPGRRRTTGRRRVRSPRRPESRRAAPDAPGRSTSHPPPNRARAPTTGRTVPDSTGPSRVRPERPSRALLPVGTGTRGRAARVVRRRLREHGAGSAPDASGGRGARPKNQDAR
jgi:single-strand DNA-binding protein